jgi:hypothetical protein
MAQGGREDPKMRPRTLVLVGALIAAAAACAAPTIPDESLAVQYETTQPTRSEDAGVEDALTPMESSTSPPPADASIVTPPSDASIACAKKKTDSACFDCCEDANPKGVTFLLAKWQTCVCAPAACAVECGTELCAGNPIESIDCEDCLDAESDDCSASAEAACPANADCAALLACNKDSDCASK